MWWRPVRKVAREGEQTGAPEWKVGEAHAFGSQRVENRCIDWPPVTANVAVAEVVNEEGDNIRWFSFALCSENVFPFCF